MRRASGPPLSFAGLSAEEEVDVRTHFTALAIKVGDVQARAWARGRIAEILASREEPTP